MLLGAIVLVAAGIVGLGIIVAAVVCMVAMPLMMRAMPQDGDRR
jgi:hypothetical protein